MRTLLIAIALTGCAVDKSPMYSAFESDASMMESDADLHTRPDKDGEVADAGPADSAGDVVEITDAAFVDADLDATLPMVDAGTDAAYSRLPAVLHVQCQPCYTHEDCGPNATCSSLNGVTRGVCSVRCTDRSVCNSTTLLTCPSTGLCTVSGHADHKCSEWLAIWGL